MKKLISSRLLCALFSAIVACTILLSDPTSGFAQCKPSIKVNGQLTVINPNDDFGLHFPLWLNEGQTLALGSSVSGISVIEFTENGNALEYSHVLYLTSTSPQSVPEGKVWKVESVVKDNNSSTYRSVTFSTAGTYNWKVPGCAEEICIEIWGAGGGGSGNNTGNVASGAGAGGGGFGSQCFAVVPNTTYAVTVGLGGSGGIGSNPGQNGSDGGSSSVTGLISANGGTGGVGGTPATGGTGGISTAADNAQGSDGVSGLLGCNSASPSGRGGAGANGGAGGAAVYTATTGNAGAFPGGGGSGGGPGNCSSAQAGGRGADGKVVISW